MRSSQKCLTFQKATTFSGDFLKTKHKKSHAKAWLDFFCTVTNYLVAGAAGAGVASVVVVVVVVAVVSTGAASTGAASGATTSVSVVVVSVVSAALSLQDTTVNVAITAKLKNTFFILLNYKRLIINSRQRYKFFNMENYFSNFF